MTLMMFWTIGTLTCRKLKCLQAFEKCTLCNGFCYRPVVLQYDIGVKIKNLSKTLDDIATEKDRFSISFTSGTQELKPPMTTSVIHVSKVHGRDEEKKTIIDLLLGKSSQEKMSLLITSIVGTGGIGKTAVAQSSCPFRQKNMGVFL